MTKKIGTNETLMKKSDFEQYLKEHSESHKVIQYSLTHLHTKIDAIASVSVNGRVGLQESLQDIYELTIELRNVTT